MPESVARTAAAKAHEYLFLLPEQPVLLRHGGDQEDAVCDRSRSSALRATGNRRWRTTTVSPRDRQPFRDRGASVGATRPYDGSLRDVPSRTLKQFVRPGREPWRAIPYSIHLAEATPRQGCLAHGGRLRSCAELNPACARLIPAGSIASPPACWPRKEVPPRAMASPDEPSSLRAGFTCVLTNRSRRRFAFSRSCSVLADLT